MTIAQSAAKILGVTVKEKLPSKDRLAELATFNPSIEKGVLPVTMEELNAMASALLASNGQVPVAEVIEGVIYDHDENGQPLSDKHIHYSLDDIEALPIGTKLYAIFPEPSNNS